jgi:hypothetical protein
MGHKLADHIGSVLAHKEDFEESSHVGRFVDLCCDVLLLVLIFGRDVGDAGNSHTVLCSVMIIDAVLRST